MTVKLLAPAKINLTLHITGQRDDGYHKLDSLVAFGPAYDVLQVDEAEENALHITGPESAQLKSHDDNLILRAARLLDIGSAKFKLQKNLPVASGIGGGSSDAATAMRGLMMLYADRHELRASTDEHLARLGQKALALGADIPMCMLPRTLRARGIGENISFVELPPMACVLVNPRVEVSTPKVFKALISKENPAMPAAVPTFASAQNCIEWLADQRNDLQAPAQGLVREIDQVLNALEGQHGCGLARMSGSGATCFGLFADLDKAKAAAGNIATRHPNWWVAGGPFADGRDWTVPVR